MNTGFTIAIIGMSAIAIYAIIKLLNFYGVGLEVYGIYLVFYVFILISIFILPVSEPKV
jgi:hypothetical protein